jgi:hypothetical protein
VTCPKKRDLLGPLIGVKRCSIEVDHGERSGGSWTASKLCHDSSFRKFISCCRGYWEHLKISLDTSTFRLCLNELGLILIRLQGDMFAEMASQLMNRRLSMKGGLQSVGKEEVSLEADTFRSGFRNSLLKAGAGYESNVLEQHRRRGNASHPEFVVASSSTFP